jgi:transposase InsO family protein
MDSNSVPADVRWAIANWPDDAARGEVARFCERHGIGRTVFYKIRRIAERDGVMAAIEPGSRRPHVSPGRTDQAVIDQALAMRAWLIDNGHDGGPLSVIDRMRRAGLTPPSRATLARAFAAAGVSKKEPKKKPRAALRRFVYPAPNCCWQLDGFEWSLADGSPATILQLIDDNTRLDLGSLVARGETTKAAVQVVMDAIRVWGVPQKLLSDNGLAFNPSRRGFTGKLVEILKGLGVEPITGKPGKPTTQGKNERSHQPLQKWLNAHPPAQTLAELQALVDQWREDYNHQRGHQGLHADDGTLMTPWEAWQARAKAAEPVPPTPPLPPLPPSVHRPPVANVGPVSTTRPRRRHDQPDNGYGDATIKMNGQTKILGCLFYISTKLAGQKVHAIWNETTVEFFDHQGESIRTYPRPAQTGWYFGPRSPHGTPLKNWPRQPRSGQSGTVQRVVPRGGYVAALGNKFYVGTKHISHTITIRWDDTIIAITASDGTTLRTYPMPHGKGQWIGPRNTPPTTMS